MPPGVTVSVAADLPAADLRAASEALFADLPAETRRGRAGRLLTLIADGEIDPAGLLVARADGAVVGAVLIQFHPGATAVVSPPGADRPGVADALAAAAVGRLRSAGAKLAQAVVPPADRGRAVPLERAGFRHVTDLAFFGRPASGAPPFDPAASPLTFAPVPAPEPRFAGVLLATYDGTLDCPELNGSRSADEILTGYAAKADPPAWWLASDATGPVGVVLFAPGPAAGVTELSYLGLVPAARGRGLGRVLLRFAMSRSADPWLTLSADVRNTPALRLYRAHGFREYDRQHVLLWHP